MTKRALLELLQTAPDDVKFFVHGSGKNKDFKSWEEAAVITETPGRICFIPASSVPTVDVE